MSNVKYKIKPYIMLLPIMLFIVGIFIIGIIFGLLQSFGYFPAIGMNNFTIKYYKAVITSANFLSSLKFSMYTSLISSLLSVVLGVLLSYLLIFNKNNKKGVLTHLYKLPIMVPHTIAALLIFILFTQSGLLPRILYSLGFISEMSEFPPLVFDTTGFGIIFAYLWKGLPFITMVTYDILKKVNARYSKIAANLGASNFQIFWYVLMPLLMPTIASGFVIIFAFSFGAFEIPYLLGPSTPKAMPILSYIHYNSVNLSDRPIAMVFNMCITLCSFALVGIYLLAFQFIKKFNS